MNIAAPIFFFAQQRETIDEAFPGDIIGIPNHGTLRVGDTLTEGEALRFTGIPNFAPEILRRVVLEDAMRAKQLNKALNDLAEEGVVQIFRPRRRRVADPRRGRYAAARGAGLAAQGRIRRVDPAGGRALRDRALDRERQARRAAALPRCEPLQRRGGPGSGRRCFLPAMPGPCGERSRNGRIFDFSMSVSASRPARVRRGAAKYALHRGDRTAQMAAPGSGFGRAGVARSRQGDGSKNRERIGRSGGDRALRRLARRLVGHVRRGGLAAQIQCGARALYPRYGLPALGPRSR